MAVPGGTPNPQTVTAADAGAAAPDPASKGLGAPRVYYPPCSAHAASPSPTPLRAASRDPMSKGLGAGTAPSRHAVILSANNRCAFIKETEQPPG